MKVTKTEDIINLIDTIISDYDESINPNHIAVKSRLKKMKDTIKNELSFENKPSGSTITFTR